MMEHAHLAAIYERHIRSAKDASERDEAFEAVQEAFEIDGVIDDRQYRTLEKLYRSLSPTVVRP